VVIRRVDALQLSELLGSLMASVVDAQARAARTTVDFIESVGFETAEDGRDRLRTVSVQYQKLDENGDDASFIVNVPLLALVNVPHLAVDTASFSLAYDVVSAVAAEDPVRPVKLAGVIRQKAGTASSAARQTTSVDVDVTLKQSALPIGVERLFDLAELGITEAKVEQPPNPS
jgi:hypothetical protein